MDIIRSYQCNAPVTQEEVAYKLFELVTKKDGDKLDKSAILKTYAECLFTVKNPEMAKD